MAPDRWQQIAALCGEAMEIAATDRRAFLRARCGDDVDLRKEVESLLAVATQSGLLDLKIASEEFKPEAVIGGRFRIVRLLGRGGMGEVYQAEDLQMGGHIALKTVRSEILHDPRAAELFKREIQLAKKVTHPNVCRIYDVGFHPSSSDPAAKVFLTMELLEGHTLSNCLESGAMSTAQALPLIQQMADGLGAAHRSGVVHRDFKTGNVMVIQHSGDTRAVVMDFGLAHTAAQAMGSQAEVVTQTHGAVGTPEYMAPEQLTGGAITPATDIYALGIVIYEMVTGRRPFQGQTPLDVAIRRLHETPVSPRELAPDLEPRWEKTILRCLSRRPEERFQSTSEVLGALSGTAEIRGRTRPWKKFLAAAGVFAILAIAGTLVLRSLTRNSTEHLEWQQLTNFSDAATEPRLSPDGRMLVFKRGAWFISPGQIYVKLLPDGQPVALTNDPFPKMAPAFTPDGSRVDYTAIHPGTSWEIWEASVLQGGGEPRRMLSNAEGLTWLDKQHILFSESRSPDPLMVVATSTESRTSSRDVYVPQNLTWMAHFSALSPDHKQVLIVEMQPGASENWSDFGSCRLVPFDGSSKGRQVGPVPGHCIAAAWSPNGKWMYFSARRENDNFHLWRQSSQAGEPEQVTSGPAQEEGLAISPDGRSVVTSVGTDRAAVWVHDADGEHQISGEGDAESPQFAPDGKRVYYLSPPDLWVAELASGHAERVLPGVALTLYALSPDGNGVAYVTTDGSLWYSSVDRQTPPHIIAPRGHLTQFSASGDILFQVRVGQRWPLYGIKADGSGMREMPANPGDLLHNVSALSPDEEWSIRVSDKGAMLAYPRNGGTAVTLCSACYTGWTSDAKFFWITLHRFSGQNAVTGLVPLKNKSMLPPLPREGVLTLADLMKIPRVRTISSGQVSPAPDGASYAFVKKESRWNLYRVPLPK
jgi:eukaryotic-like serine/threonine-protein kinase